ncbi:hypothetical protein ACFQ88_16245 [Paenibacillus sp. NPDC056579]|uniref:hypothetical protein n=1 Tax=unclassified Paenibacillus TaxID=185978 RepID=UPI001EF87085|nr:hypothetical protein [Paenibacillus sp. H1-7]ULL17961.1 hypothetical protein DVH26_27945 [Paenibacillus sp. H1-7]
MSRTSSYHKLLVSAVSFQKNVYLILEAKSFETTRACRWICNHLAAEHLGDHNDQVKKCLEIHEQLIEVIDGLTKMEQALTKNLQAILDDGEADNGGISG